MTPTPIPRHPLIERLNTHRFEQLWTWPQVGADMNARTGRKSDWHTWQSAYSKPRRLSPMSEAILRRYFAVVDREAEAPPATPPTTSTQAAA